jgi:hypothetical protein
MSQIMSGRSHLIVRDCSIACVGKSANLLNRHTYELRIIRCEFNFGLRTRGFFVPVARVGASCYLVFRKKLFTDCSLS